MIFKYSFSILISSLILILNLSSCQLLYPPGVIASSSSSSSGSSSGSTQTSFTVTFDSQGATTAANPSSITVTWPATTVGTLPAAPAKTGFTFGGWYTSPNGGGSPFTAATTVTANITVYAYWANYLYTVKFDSQGATVAANPSNIIVTSPATTVGTLPSPPTKTGYNFGGWYTSPNGGGKAFLVGTAVTANITVYAYWSINPVYTVTYDSQGGTAVGTQFVTLPATTVGTLPAAPTKTGFIFGGWYTAPGGGGSPFTATTTVAANITVYAYWASYSYTVTFDSQGATVAANPSSIIVSSPATAAGTLPTAPAKTGYNFGGWFTATGGGGSPFTATTTVAANITVYALWSPPSIYTAGRDANSPAYEACYWSNQTKTLAQNGNYPGRANSIFINNGIVYTAGEDSNGNPCYWTGTNETQIATGGQANAIFVYGGNVYTAGTDPSGRACYWVGTTENPLQNGALATSIYVYGGTVYTAGADTNDIGYDCYWVGTSEYQGTLDGGIANSIYVDGGTVYTAGSDGNGNAFYGIGAANEFQLGAGDIVNSIFVTNGTMYMAGQIGANAYYWVGTTPTLLQSGGSANSIYVFNGSIFISGADNSGNACYWVDGTETPLSTGGIASSIYVTP